MGHILYINFQDEFIVLHGVKIEIFKMKIVDL